MEKTMATFNIDDLHRIFMDANMEATKNCPGDYTSPRARKAFEAAEISGAFWERVWIMNAAARNDHDDAAAPILVLRPPYMKDGVETNATKADYCCPRCGCNVGELYVPDNYAESDDHYCADCGQRIDWQSIEAEQRKAKEDGR